MDRLKHLLGVLVLAILVLPRISAASGSSETFTQFFSDPQMTNQIGEIDRTCGNHIFHSGIYEGGPGWYTYLKNNRNVWHYSDTESCLNGYSGFSCVWYNVIPNCDPEVQGQECVIMTTISCPY